MNITERPTPLTAKFSLIRYRIDELFAYAIAMERKLALCREALEKIAGKTPGKFPPGTGVGLAIAHEQLAAKALKQTK